MFSRNEREILFLILSRSSKYRGGNDVLKDSKIKLKDLP
jgi:hypothetical protein